MIGLYTSRKLSRQPFRLSSLMDTIVRMIRSHNLHWFQSTDESRLPDNLIIRYPCVVQSCGLLITCQGCSIPNNLIERLSDVDLPFNEPGTIDGNRPQYDPTFELSGDLRISAVHITPVGIWCPDDWSSRLLVLSSNQVNHDTWWVPCIGDWINRLSADVQSFKLLITSDSTWFPASGISGLSNQVEPYGLLITSDIIKSLDDLITVSSDWLQTLV